MTSAAAAVAGVRRIRCRHRNLRLLERFYLIEYLIMYVNINYSHSYVCSTCVCLYFSRYRFSSRTCPVVTILYYVSFRLFPIPRVCFLVRFPLDLMILPGITIPGNIPAQEFLVQLFLIWYRILGIFPTKFLQQIIR